MDTATSSPPVHARLQPWRCLWRVPLLAGHIVLAILLAGLVMSWNQNRVMRNGREPLPHRLIRWWAAGLLRIFGLRTLRIGEPLHDPVLFVANHTSWIDIVLLHSQRAVCFVAKAEIAHWPLVGWLAASGGTIFHRRGSNYSLTAVMQVMVMRLRAERSVGVFPEGGTSHHGELKVFHARLFQAALDAPAAVQPVALRFVRDGRRELDAGFRDGESFIGNFLRLLAGEPMTVEVHFLPPVPPSPHARRQMAELARERIGAALEDHAA
ncbi:MAG TPA: lysophospholipid acyltransferase family protein [Rhodanobacter sp.]|nr:lysophospholipid acyltransferase family protein [Rhodanobacter sp.]